jgi:hypothetical protein
MMIWTMILFVSGCATGPSDSALVTNLREPIRKHASALAGDDVKAMRRTGLVVIEKFDAGAR